MGCASPRRIASAVLPSSVKRVGSHRADAEFVLHERAARGGRLLPDPARDASGHRTTPSSGSPADIEDLYE